MRLQLNCGSTMFELSYCEELNTPYIVFNDTECTFRKSSINKYLVFCETEKKIKNAGELHKDY